MDEAWSFWEDAVFALACNTNANHHTDIAKGRAVIDPALQAIEQWLITRFELSESRSAGWLFLTGGSVVGLIVSTVLETRVAILATFLLLVFATGGYWRVKSYWRRLVRRVKAGATAPKPFDDFWSGSLKEHMVALPSSGRILFDANHHPTSIAHQMSPLDLVWLSGIMQSEPLKRALFASDLYPVKVLRPLPPVVVEKPEQDSSQIVVTNVMFDQRQVHGHASRHQEENQTAKPEPKPVRRGKSDLTRPWITDVAKADFPDLLVEFKKYLPAHLGWMAVVIEHAAPLIEKHPGWSQTKILTHLLDQFEKLSQWTDLKVKPKRDTIEKIFYRDRCDGKYVWVRQFFTDRDAQHKYRKESELSFQFESDTNPGTASEPSG